jgi:DNA (cytosine-5)-methyltransferase 1
VIYGSVCSGIEAASVAWSPLGWRAAFLSEIEPFPRAVLSHHYPAVSLHGDFTTIQAEQYDAIDLLVGGTPCQSFSIAGLRGGLADDRGNLALEYLLLAKRLRPRWLVWENVPGVLSSNGGRDFGSILGGLGELGYGFAYRVLDAQYVRVDGFGRAVPQRRRRVFLVGHLGNWRRAAAVLFERDCLQGHPAPRREAGERPAPTLAARTKSGGGLGTDFDCDGGLVALNDLGGVSHALTAKHSATGRYDPNGETWVAHSLRGGGFDASEDGTGRGTPLVPICFDETQITSAANRCNPQPGDPSHPLASGARPPTIAFSAKDHGADATVELSPTLRAGGHSESHANAGVMPAVMQGWRVRRLTPLECERLQGFPDDYTAVAYRGKKAADGPRYKALGNSMAVNCMRWIGRRIEMVERMLEKAA